MDGQPYASGLPVGMMALPSDPTAAAQTAASFPHLGLGMPMDPSTAMLLSGLTAQQLAPHPDALTAQQAPQPAVPGAFFSNTVFGAPPHGNAADLSNISAPPGSVPAAMPLGTDPALGLHPKSGPGAATVAPGAEKEATPGGSTAQAAPAPAAAAALEAKPPADPNDPEAVAAALVARITAVGATIIFEKSLTASDVSGGGRVVVPKSVAEQYFPRLEQPSGVTISATDLDGRSYTFKWRFWVNNSSRMYLLEGAGELHRNYGLEVGDVMVFAQKADGGLVVAGRVANKSDLVKKPPTKRPAAHSAAAAAAGARGGRESKTARAPPRPQQQQQQQQHPTPDGAAAAALASAPGNPAAAAAAVGRGGGSSAAGPAAAAAGAAGGRKRKGTATPASGTAGGDPRVSRGRVDEGVSLAVLDMEAPSDGIFRAVVLQHIAPVPLGVALARNNRWTATLDVAGELYQAYFDTREDAAEAIMAAGGSP